MSLKQSSLIFMSTILAVAGLICASGVQAADDGGWYLGAGVGQSSGSGLGGIDTTLANYGIVSTSTVGSTAIAWKVVGGYQVNKYFGAEGGYANFGQYSVNSLVTVPGAGNGTATWQASNIWSLAAIGYVPIQDQFSLFGKIGLAYSSVSFNYSDTVGDAISASKNSTVPLYGVGLKYNGSSPWRVGSFGMILDLREHAGENLEA